jgi:hypothetical protein
MIILSANGCPPVPQPGHHDAGRAAQEGSGPDAPHEDHLRKRSRPTGDSPARAPSTPPARPARHRPTPTPLTITHMRENGLAPCGKPPDPSAQTNTTRDPGLAGPPPRRAPQQLWSHAARLSPGCPGRNGRRRWRRGTLRDAAVHGDLLAGDIRRVTGGEEGDIATVVDAWAEVHGLVGCEPAVSKGV